LDCYFLHFFDMNDKFTIADLFQAKAQKRKIAAVSCYDYTTAELLAKTDIEMVLVGDSAAQVVLGFDSTLPATMDFMVTITAAVRRGAPAAFLVADMPFLSYQSSVAEAVKNAGRFLTQAGAQMVKIEATPPYLETIKAVSNAGIPVMAHIGIMPQTIAKTGRLKAQGTTAEMALDLINFAEKTLSAGASALLLEGTATEVAAIVTERCEVPVIGCGSGPHCDGQILIAPDILGLSSQPTPKFAKAYAQLSQDCIKAFEDYCSQVRQNKYPDDQHSYHMKKGQLKRLDEFMKT